MTEKSRGRPRSEKARSAILSSAVQLLTTVGITGLTIEGVAAHAKVGKPTIYRYWANAHDLAMAALMEQKNDATSTDAVGPPLKQLQMQLADVIDRFATPSGRQAAILMASADPESELSKAFRNQVILQSREAGRPLILNAIEEGELSDNLAIDALLDMIYGPIFYRLLVGHAPVDRKLAGDLVSTISKLKPSS